MNSQAKKLQNVIATSVFFISGNRLVSFLKILLDAKINRKVAVCKELTKKNERVFRGYIKKIIDEINIDKSNLKGEFTLLIQGKERKTKIKNGCCFFKCATFLKGPATDFFIFPDLFSNVDAQKHCKTSGKSSFLIYFVIQSAKHKHFKAFP